MFPFPHSDRSRVEKLQVIFVSVGKQLLSAQDQTVTVLASRVKPKRVSHSYPQAASDLKAMF